MCLRLWTRHWLDGVSRVHVGKAPRVCSTWSGCASDLPPCHASCRQPALATPLEVRRQAAGHTAILLAVKRASQPRPGLGQNWDLVPNLVEHRSSQSEARATHSARLAAASSNAAAKQLDTSRRIATTPGSTTSGARKHRLLHSRSLGRYSTRGCPANRTRQGTAPNTATHGPSSPARGASEPPESKERASAVRLRRVKHGTHSCAPCTLRPSNGGNCRSPSKPRYEQPTI